MENASQTLIQSGADSRAQRLRAAMGIRVETGSCAIQGCRVAWQEICGADRNAVPVLCLHAFGAGSREFRPLVDRRPAASRLILVDWPGHGRSGELSSTPQKKFQELTIQYFAGIVASLLGELKIDRPILLGSGFGAAVAIQFAVDFPSRPLGLVLCEPAGLLPESSRGPSFSGGKRELQALLRQVKEYAPENLPAQREVLRLQALRPAMRSALAAAATSLARSNGQLQAAIESLPCPVLFALSRDNREYPLRKYMALLDPSLAWAPQHQYTVFAGGFNPIWDEPEQFAQALKTFLEPLLPLKRHDHAWTIAADNRPAADTILWKCIDPECGAQRALPIGQDPNAEPRRG